MHMNSSVLHFACQLVVSLKYLWANASSRGVTSLSKRSSDLIMNLCACAGTIVKKNILRVNVPLQTMI